MRDVVSTYAAAEGFARRPARLIFDAERETPDLVEAVADVCPSIHEIMAGIRHSIPLAPDAVACKRGQFLRLPGHFRSICCAVGPTDAADTTSEDAGVIVFKGTEPLLEDFPDYLQWMLNNTFRGTYLPVGLYFPLVIKLPPAAMWLEECVREQHTASAVQQAHLMQYGELARLPTPLFVHEFGDEDRDRYIAEIRRQVGPAAFERVESKVRGGLGVEIYYYPSVPLRVLDLAAPEMRSADGELIDRADLEEAVGRWTTLFARLLHLGYMPYAPWNVGMGACIDAGNACLDGGFVDLLTLVPTAAIPDGRVFRGSLSKSVDLLAQTVSILCGLMLGLPRSLEHQPEPMTIAYVRQLLLARLEAERPVGQQTDPRIVDGLCVSDLQQVLDDIACERRPTSLYRGPAPSLDTPTAIDGAESMTTAGGVL